MALTTHDHTPRNDREGGNTLAVVAAASALSAGAVAAAFMAFGGGPRITSGAERVTAVSASSSVVGETSHERHCRQMAAAGARPSDCPR